MEIIKARVFQEGRFIKAITEDGRDVSNQIERDVRRKAIESNMDVEYDATTSTWVLSFKTTSIAPEASLDQPINEEISKHEQITKFIHQSVTLKPKSLIISDLKWKYLIRSAMRGKNILMTGPAGSGKTMAAKYLVTALERPDFYFNLGATQDPRATLIGNTHFQKDTGTYFSESLFVQAIQTPNAVILLDELSRAHPEAWNILMTVLDLNQRYLRLDEKDGAPTIKVAEGVSFIATANIGNEYTSTRVMDRALMDRFITIEMDQLNQQDELKLLTMLFPNVSKTRLSAIAEIAHQTRLDVASANPKLTSALSTRSSVEVASLIYDGFTLAEAAEVAIYPFYSVDGGAESERTFVKQLVQKHDVPVDPNQISNLFGVSDIKS